MPKKAKRRRGRPPIEGLTLKQQDTLRSFRAFVTRRGKAPTISELAKELNVTGATAYASVCQLIRKGFLKREESKCRGISITRTARVLDSQKVDVPVLGQVSAGRPIFAEENVMGTVSVDSFLVQNGRYFGLKVVGDSMTGAGIRNGDTVIVRLQPLAEDGDIVVASLGDEYTVKRLSYSPECIELHAENRKYRPIEIGLEMSDEFRIVGRVVSHLDSRRK